MAKENESVKAVGLIKDGWDLGLMAVLDLYYDDLFTIQFEHSDVLGYDGEYPAKPSVLYGEHAVAENGMVGMGDEWGQLYINASN